ncbi:AMP-binding protein [Sinimarinibacterium sp. CAU 1509]|uniref:AMP-binding protein n=1 Tax=Sinimarinibacterium sp. CAU 1509 TaxID=2562283 RepID=UPI0010ABFA04|nr:AMP-binding protein [Sinimarinibacterium sp. CAU 1509]TJY59525.1 AMP-binding protein [Sinimarinibacterium sp. CAU 1509]
MPEMSYTSGPCNESLLGQTIGDNLRRTVERQPDREALVVRSQNYRASYRELWEQTENLARALMALGVARGDRVGLWSPNRYEWVLIQFATARIGAILVNVNPAYRASELSYALNQSGVSVLMMAHGFRSTDYRQTLAQVRTELPQLRHVVVIDDDWNSLLGRSAEVEPEALYERESTLQFDDPINIQYTSGTTGAPKGATLTHHNILNNAWFIGRTMGYTPDDRVCIPVPFYHCFGMVIGNLNCVSHGSTMVIPGEAFDAEATLRTVAEERCTSLYGVPTMFIDMLRHPALDQLDLSSLRTGVMAGATCPVRVMEQVRERMHMSEVTICYGMTETSPVSTQTAIDDPVDKRVASVGRVLPHLEIKIISPENGGIVPIGQAGELCTRGYSVMRGYWNNPKATAESIDAGRWMHTGDLATMDRDGYVTIVGRIKDMIIRGGENIYPREIEECLYQHPQVADVQVIGIPSERYGEEVMAWVRPKDGAILESAELEAFCRERLAGYKVPRHWKFVGEFPVTVTGKVQKFRMRELASEELSATA